MSRYAVLGVTQEVPPVVRSALPESIGLGVDADEPDAELLALPAPPRTARALTVAVLALAGIIAMAMGFALLGDVAYGFRSDSAVVLGDLRNVAPGVLASAENGLVRAAATLTVAGGIRYERPFTGDSFRTMPVAGRPDVWVDLRVPPGQESGRWEPPQSFTGRLVRFESAGLRHRRLAAAIEQTTEERLPSTAFLLVDGEVPSHERRAVVLFAVMVAFALWNGASIARLFWRVR
ncbi:MAG: hypothetical protein M3O50_17515 [Myxococcota bacterium]|nr:hypothetical protein [Myxococcota bacterium]